MNKIINYYYDPTLEDRNWPYIRQEQRRELTEIVRAWKYVYPRMLKKNGHYKQSFYNKKC